MQQLDVTLMVLNFLNIFEIVTVQYNDYIGAHQFSVLKEHDSINIFQI